MLPIPDSARAVCRVTPLLRSSLLGCALKLESMQRTGSLMLRGAAFKLGRLAPVDRKPGVITASAGNHGLGLACAGRALEIPVRVVAPDSMVRCKREGISGFGGDLIRCNGNLASAEQMARRLAALRDALYISPCEDVEVIEGNGGWLAKELLTQLPSLRRVVVPMGDGGLAAGLANQLAAEGIEVIGAQPAASCAMVEALKQNRAATEYEGWPTVCEELTGSVGWRSFAVVRRLVKQIALIPESDIIDAVAFAFARLGLVVEASAAVVIAAVCTGRISVDPHTVLIITGGNIDPDFLRRCLASQQLPPHPPLLVSAEV